MIAAVSAARPDRIATQRQLNDLAIDFARTDAELTGLYERNTAPGRGWDTWFMKVANQVQDARDAYVQLRPEDEDMSARLRRDSLDLAASSGQMTGMQSSGSRVGAGWDTTLDGKLRDVTEAANRLAGADLPVPPSTPPSGGASSLQRDAQDAAQLVQQSLDTIRAVPANDTGSEATKAARIAAFHLNLDAQAKLEPHFTDADAATVSTLRTADASLEDAAWQLAKKPSPDGRFNGVDIPGAISDTQAALDALARVAG